ncbi:hypothetical protein [Halorussus salinisoli]|uniref:hypothetical protein n=1 Tax=Halorussus salinisoli TaxID=2558242 RepID=UPI0010C2312B|nr:hypothetical protein [Halorussus salinisoli]
MKSNALARMSFVAGLGVIALAVEFHLDATGSNCDGCAPFHPLFVLAPLVAGAALTLGGYALWRR